MAVKDAPTAHKRALDTTCPTCGAPAERGQLVCLECGSRIALSYRRPPSWKLPVAIAAVVAALAIAGALLAYEAIDDEAKDEVAATPLKPKKAKEAAKPKADPEASAKPKAKAKPEPKAATPTAAELVLKGKLYTWPKSLGAFTVVVLSAEDRKTATAFATSVAGAKAAKAGVIRSDDFETLPKGFFVVFAGSYPSRARADKAAARLGRVYDGAFPQLVRR